MSLGWFMFALLVCLLVAAGMGGSSDGDGGGDFD